jgi:hypothetical protein
MMEYEPKPLGPGDIEIKVTHNGGLGPHVAAVVTM